MRFCHTIFQGVVLRNLCVLTAVAALLPPVHADDEQPVAVDFELKDYGGRTHRLQDYAERPVVVLAFLGTDCPLVHRYSVRLQQIADDYAERDVVVLGVNSNRQDSMAEIAAFARRSAIRFPILRDTGNVLADKVGAERTPEVVVLDSQRQIRYRGKIDDQYGVGYTRIAVETSYLRNAIDAILDGREPSVRRMPAEGCLIGRLRDPKPDSAITYSGQIAALMNQHCVSCHREGEIGPFTLTSYDDVAGWADMIREVVRERRMPPWHADPAVGHFANARGMTEDDKQMIHQWVLAGAPAGDLDQVPPIPEKADQDWHFGRAPDKVVTMGRRFQVPEDGVVEYKYFSVDPGLTEDRWVTGAEIIPGSREVVHHVLVFVRSPDEQGHAPAAGGGAFLAVYVPGMVPTQLPDGMAKLIPAGSQLVFQMHYTPNGVAQTDESKIGLYFADDADVDHVVTTQEARNSDFTIPPGAAAFPVSSRSRTAPTDLKLLGMMPHMHLRGKSFRYTAVRSDGVETDLLNVPEYDFNWQTSYRLAEPLPLKAGTFVRCQAEFDNSAANLNNPDPGDTVGWGDQTTDEMMIGYFDIAVPRAIAARASKTPQADWYLQKFDRNGDRMLQRDEVPARLHQAFDRLDVNRNRELTRDELAALDR